MVLYLKFDARGLSGNHEPTEDLALHPDLAVFADDDTFGLAPIVVVESLDDVDLLLIGDQLLLTFPEYTDTGSDFVPKAG